MVIEGIILQKAPQKEKDLMVTLLSRDGQKYSIYCYGGRGGGKKKVSSLLEVGFCIQFELKFQRGRHQLSSSGWKLIWYYQKIRTNYPSFQRLCGYLQLFSLLIPAESHLGQGETQEGVFSLLANSLNILENEGVHEKHLGLLLVKLTHPLGVEINTQSCILSDEVLTPGSTFLNLQEGGFVSQGLGRRDDWDLLLFIRQAYGTLFSDCSQLKDITKEENVKLLHYISYHFGLQPQRFLIYSQ